MNVFNLIRFLHEQPADIPVKRESGGVLRDVESVSLDKRDGELIVVLD